MFKKKIADKLHDAVYKAEYKTLRSLVSKADFKLTPDQYFERNPNLKKAGVVTEYTPEQIVELNRCFKDPKYFINNYCYIVNLDEGLIKFNTRDYQDNLIDLMNENRRVIVKFPRQSGKTVTTASYVVWQIIFQPYSAIAILANKAKTAIGILQKVRLLYENLPGWIQVGVEEWNKSAISLENGSRVEASATSSSAIRSMSISTLIIDECAFVPKNIWSDFYASVYPTVSSSKKAKIFLISTPNGMNHFYKFWSDATNEKSDSEFVHYEIQWNDVPGRDEKFRKKVIAEFGKEYWDQEFNCEFLGSAGTLISGSKLKVLVWKNEIEMRLNNKLKIYELPHKEEDHDGNVEYGKYVLIFDTGEGVGSDYSTIQVFRVDEKPYRQVATFSDNTISIREFPVTIEKIGKLYNDALVIGENNTIGAAVLDDLFYDLEYENIFYGTEKTNKNEEINDQKLGIRMTARSKSLGCSNLKTNIEDDYFILQNSDTISELTWFIKKGSSWQADDNKHDDLVMPLVIFSYFLRNREWIDNWLDQDKENPNIDAIKQIEEDLLPLGFVCDGDKTSELSDYNDDDDKYFVFV